MNEMESTQALFLRQSMQDCWADYEYVCTHGRANTWDDVVITASNEAQAVAYRLQLESRLEQGFLPKQTRYHVIPDPNGARVGSGGATLNLLRELAKDCDKPFEGRRILTLHSGGDSQRVPQYSACGKLFSRVPRALPDGRASTLFDESMIALAGIANRMAEGMLVLSGDVLLLFNTLQIDLERSGAACLTIKAPASVGVNHGVFVPDDRGCVRRFLHKQSEATLRAAGAVNAQDSVDIDTGAIWLDGQVLERLHRLVETPTEAQRFINPLVRLSFYGDFLFPMASEATLEQYLEEPAEGERSAALAQCRRAIWAALSPVRLQMIRLSPARFIHFGTTTELRALMLEGQEQYAYLDWRRDVQSVGATADIAAVNSAVMPGAQVEAGCYLEDSRIGAAVQLASGCVVSHVDLSAGHVPTDWVLSGLPLEDGRFVVRVYGVGDNPKQAWQASALAPLARTLDQAQMNALLPEGETALWHARLYAVEASMPLAVQAALRLIAMVNGTASQADWECWARAERVSLKESFALASVARILHWQAKLEDIVRATRATQMLAQGGWLQEAAKQLSIQPKARARQVELLEQQAVQADNPARYKLLHAVHRLSNLRGTASEDPGYAALNQALYETVQQEQPLGRMQCERAEASLPARINFGGGWSDTPPYCLENGGTVLNAAIALEGTLPIRAWAERLEIPCVRIVSDDLGIERDFWDVGSLQKLGDPHDPFALGKAVLVACGLVPLGPNRPAVGADATAGSAEPLPIERWGGGILLRTASKLPKGSGLGGSSILAAAAIRAVLQLFGMQEDTQRVMELTLCVEQLMSTGGGWQDQAGALYPGIKLVTSKPGLRQQVRVRSLCLEASTWDALESRLSFLYTGQRRLARNILRDITDKVLEAEPGTLRILEEIQSLAALMAFELERGNVTAFGRLLNSHWELSKALDPGSSNTCIDQIVRICEELVDGLMICGAGGGGFMVLLRKAGVQEEALSARLNAVFQESGVALWRCHLIREM